MVLFGCGLDEGAAFAFRRTYLVSVVISLLGGLIFLSRSPRRAIAQRLERRRAERSVRAGGGRRP